MNRRRNRQTEINRVRSELLESGFPRIKMFLIVVLTGGAGFLSSYLMLDFGMTKMAVRYPAAVAAAYIVFLFLLWLWLRTSADDYTDIPDISFDTGSRGASNCHGDIAPDVPETEDGAISEVIGGVAQAEELAIPLLGIIAIATLAFSSLWIVYSAPVFFAELLVDGVLAATLYRRLRGIETRHWLESAVRRTFMPFAMTAIVVGLCGAVMHQYVPEATSLGDVIRSQQH